MPEKPDKYTNFQRLVIIFLLTWLAGCSTNGKTPDDISYLAKSDIDTVADIHRKRSSALINQLTTKLYKRNPLFCKQSSSSLETCIEMATTQDKSWRSQKIGDCTGSNCIELAFEPTFMGDRVLAFSSGLKDMLYAAYNQKTEFFITDEMDPQKLYNFARNIEISVWRIANKRNEQGKRFVLTDSINGKTRNLSYERLFGKLISLQDTLSEVIAERDNRRVKNIIQRLATAVFLPI